LTVLTTIAGANIAVIAVAITLATAANSAVSTRILRTLVVRAGIVVVALARL